MERTAVLGRLTWRVGEIVETRTETPHARSLTVSFEDWPGHQAGQHVDVRLTAEDGYQAVRSYSVASPPEDEQIVLTVERLDDGEVSPYLVDEVRVGDAVEVRGPIGGYFVWTPSLGGPLFLVAGGSGVVPLMAMARQRNAVAKDIPVRLLYSAKTPDDVIYREDLDGMAGSGVDVTYTYTRVRPSGWTGYERRVDRMMLEEVGWSAAESPQIYVCGPTAFVEAVASDLLALGHDPRRVRTERFGPTGV
jgi:ferredoxin-NADP reductase